MKKVITYGTYDLLHQGHINLLRRAKELGDWLIVGVTTDNFDLERGKMNTCNNVMERIEAVKATGYADQIIIEEYKGQKIDDIQKYGVDIFAIGSDWEGYFDYLKEYCEVVYLPRTEGISSTQLREERPSVKVGIIGTGSIAARFVPESKVVNSIEIAAAYNPNVEHGEAFCKEHGIPVLAKTQEELFTACDAVYVASPHYTHYEYVKASLEAGKHVICETPFVFKTAQAEELFRLADEKNLVLMVAHKTAYCPAFGHLVSLLKSGAIGEIVDVNASVTTLTDERSAKMDSSLLGGSMSENACFPLLPVFKFLGTDYRDVRFYSKMKNGVHTVLSHETAEEGENLSGGDAQKVAIARALYKDAPFVILDEPTAALDPLAEAEIYENFRELVGDKTSIYISHRMSSCRFCGRIIVLSGGGIAEEGTHEDLLQAGGLYAELFNTQAQYYQTA